MKKLNYLVILPGILFLSTLSCVAIGMTYYQISSSATVTIDEQGTCKNVRNDNTQALFVPTNTSAEWLAFLNNAPGVTLSDCSSCQPFSYGGQNYSVVQIGTQCWMAENLNIGTRANPVNNGAIEKYCYNNLESNCTTYGGLYDWNETMQYVTTPGARGVCPVNWHIPTDGEFYTLENFLKDTAMTTCVSSRIGLFDCRTAGNKLKVGGITGFEGKYAGLTEAGANTYGMGTHAYFWTSTFRDIFWVWARALTTADSGVFRGSEPKAEGLSVRCIKD